MTIPAGPLRETINNLKNYNHIFINGINQIPRKYFGNCKMYTEYGSLKYQGGYMFGNYHGYGKLIINKKFGSELVEVKSYGAY